MAAGTCCALFSFQPKGPRTEPLSPFFWCRQSLSGWSKQRKRGSCEPSSKISDEESHEPPE